MQDGLASNMTYYLLCVYQYRQAEIVLSFKYSIVLKLIISMFQWPVQLITYYITIMLAHIQQDFKLPECTYIVVVYGCLQGMEKCMIVSVWVCHAV